MTELKGRVKPSMELQVIDISEHGMLVETPSGLLPGNTCEFTVHAPFGDLVIRARIANCRAMMVKNAAGRSGIRFRAGLEFAEGFAASPEIKELISAVCSLEGAGEVSGRVTLHGEMRQTM
jgi:hypothetical protein